MDEDGKHKYVTIRQVFITVGLRKLHLLMMKPTNEGGYKDVWHILEDGSRVSRFFKNTLRHYWPNYLKEMSDADKVICGCSFCLDTDDVVAAYNDKRRKIIRAAEVEIEEMEESTRTKKGKEGSIYRSREIQK